MEEKNVIKESDLPKQPKAEPSKDQYLVLTEPVFANLHRSARVSNNIDLTLANLSITGLPYNTRGRP